MSLLMREVPKNPLRRRLNDHYRLFPCEYPDLCAVCALDSGLVRRNHVAGAPPATARGACCHRRTGAFCPSPLWALRSDRFCRRALRLCDQRRTNAGSLLRVPPALGQCVHGPVRTRSFAGPCDALALSRRVGSERSRVPAHPVSHRPPGSSLGDRATARRAVGPATKSLTSLPCGLDTRGSPPTRIAEDGRSARSTATFASPVRTWLHWTQARGSRAEPYHDLAGPYASVSRHVWKPRQRRISGGTASSSHRHAKLSSAPFPS